MTADDQNTSAPRRGAVAGARRRARVLARGVFLRAGGPIARRRMQHAELARAVARLEGDLKHLRERHTEQIERLEDLVRELILTAEELRSLASRQARGDLPGREEDVA
jgi:hypothetical protein